MTTSTHDSSAPGTGRRLPLQRLPLPTIRRQRLYALLVLVAQAGIAVTGSIVRVTGSGLGCETWPQCHPGSFTPVAGAAPALHQAIEFGNRLLTFVLVALTLLLFLAVVRAGRRREIKVLALISGLGIIVQAVIGGVSVWVDLKWYAVALHFLPSMLLVWIAGLAYVKVAEPDDGAVTRTYPPLLRRLAALCAAAMTATLITGTMVTGAGPHAGDATVAPEDRLNLPIVDLTHVHAGFMYLLLGLVIGLIFALAVSEVDSAAVKLGAWLFAMILIQGGVGMIQYWNDVPEALVPVHVAGSGIVTGLTAVLFALGLRRIGGAATVTGSTAGDAEHAAAR
ncbi:COX15/CtaA family protein [Corynebacterium sphenisci]|uniref:COX15/CtaA family protein n=1 Tax=Corynebacterium sphenisci TaxID=191493 RepID=UPI000AB1CD85|nr:COX15/CtaA family protein [Corynebacterium sphenisci]